MDYMEPTREKNELKGMLKNLRYLLMVFSAFLGYVVYNQASMGATGGALVFTIILGLTGYWCFIQVPNFSNSLDGLDEAYWNIVEHKTGKRRKSG